ncbi:MAG: Hydroxyneurosporene desaturase [Pseudomonadota bacterium]
MSEAKVVVVGAGIGGLVSALLLAQRGLQVSLVEAHPQPGGKIHTRTVDGLAIDSGPTVMTMRWVFDEVFHHCGTTLESELDIEPLTVLARHFWPDGERIDLLADPQASEAEMERFGGPNAALEFRRFCERTRAIHDVLQGPFMCSHAPRLAGFAARLGPSGLALLTHLGPMRTLWQQLQRQFSHPRLRQLFGRYATYCGSSPWQAPATLMLIAQVEMDGVWSVKGGMHALARSLLRLAQQKGVTCYMGRACERLETHDGKVTGVILADGERLAADSVVFNGDPGALRQGLLGKGVQTAVPTASPERSLSALTWSAVIPRSSCDLDRHNVFFQNDYASEFEDIFDEGRLPRQPTVYVCAQDRPAADKTTNQSDDRERLLCLVNAPARGEHPFDEEELQQCQSTSFKALMQHGLNLQGHPMVRTDPHDFHQRFPASSGALYGQATHGWMSIFARPGARTSIPGLHLAGGGVHPGPGVPMAALSGLRAAEAVWENLGLTNPWHQEATYGGMSTR